MVGAILNSGERYPDAKKMLDWAFEQKTAKLDLRQLPKGAERD